MINKSSQNAWILPWKCFMPASVLFVVLKQWFKEKKTYNCSVISTLKCFLLK